MKYILLMLLPLLLPADYAVDDFNQAVDNGYQTYTIIEDYESNYYRLKVVQGINDDNVMYGVILFNKVPNSHTLTFVVNDQIYTVSENNRGDYIALAIKMKEDITIHVVDEMGNSRRNVVINNLKNDEFLNSFPNAITGLGEGVTTTNLQRFALSPIIMISLIFGAIILAFSLIIIMLIFSKRGMFNKNNRVKDVFNFKEYAKELSSQSFDDDEDEQLDRETDEPEIVNMYPYQREYDDDDDRESFIDVEGLLKEKGYNTDYQTATEFEKNDIMLELMRLRDFQDITAEQYKQEIIKLWKK